MPEQSCLLAFIHPKRERRERGIHANWAPLSYQLSLLRRMDRSKWTPTLLAATNAVSWLDGDKKEEEVRRGLGKMGVETLKVTRDGDSYLVSLRGRIREQTSERSRDSMTEMWAGYSLAVLHGLLTSFTLDRNGDAYGSAKILQTCLKGKLQS